MTKRDVAINLDQMSQLYGFLIWRQKSHNRSATIDYIFRQGVVKLARLNDLSAFIFGGLFAFYFTHQSDDHIRQCNAWLEIEPKVLK